MVLFSPHYDLCSLDVYVGEACRSPKKRALCLRLSIVERFVPFGVAAFFLLILQPFYLFGGLHPYDHQRWLETLMLAYMLLVGLPLIARYSFLLNAFWLYVFLLFGLATIISSILSSAGWVSWVSLLRMWLYLVLLTCIPFSFSKLSDSARSKFGWAVLAGLGVYAIYSCVGLIVLAGNDIYDRTVAVVGFANVNHAAGFLALAVLIIPALVFNASSRPSGVCHFTGIVVSTPLIMLLFVIGSRGSFLGMVSGVGAVFLLAKRDVAFEYSKRLGGYFIVGVFFYGVLRWVTDGIPVPEKNLTSDSGRFYLYMLAWDGIIEAPFFGNGPLSYAAHDKTALTHPHNLLLTFLYEYGGVATLIGVLLLAALSVWVLKNRTRWSGSLEAAAGMAVVVAFAVHSQVSGLAMIPLSLCVLALGVGLWGAPLVTGVRINYHFRWWHFCGAFAVGGVYLILVSLYWLGLNDGMMTSPRFWLQGKLPLGS